MTLLALRSSSLPLVGLALAACVLVAGCASFRSYESLLVLADAAAGAGPSRLKAVTPAPRRVPVTYEVGGRMRSGDLYLPDQAPPEAGIVLVPGAVPKGKDDPRLVAFAGTLARARFAVLAPDLAGFRSLRISPGDAREVADAFAYLAGRADLVPSGRAGIGAFSYAVGPALLAAMEEDVRARVRFVVGVGGYYDLGRALQFFTTGYFEADGTWRQLEPDDFGKLVFVHSARPYLGDAGDVALLDAMVARRLADRSADLADLASQLGPDGRAVFALVTNQDPARFEELVGRLPAALQADLAALSLHNKDWSRLTARLILTHGRNDNLIPYPESIALARAARPGQARLYLMNRILGHVDLSLGRVLSWRFLSEELPDLWRMWRAMDALLAQREATE